jgi:hypothetical protein
MRAGLALLVLGAVVACKPPPTEADMARELPGADLSAASAPLPSPDSEGAIWTVSAQDSQRIIYGVPGSPALMALTCLTDMAPSRVRITRLSPADEGAGALLAFIGNGHIGRIEVDATMVERKSIWQGEVPADDERLEPLAGPRQFTATIPGAGMVTFNPSPMPMEWLEACRET